MNRVDVMVDIETLGKRIDSTIFQIAAASFNLKTGQIYNRYNRMANIELDRLNVDGSTLKWWLNTDKDLLHKLLSKGEGSVNSMILEFHKWLNDIVIDSNVFLWGNGILFDNKMIQYQMNKYNLEYPIKYKNDRDVRTIVEAASVRSGLTEKEIKDKFSKQNLVDHNALDDVEFQIHLVSGCYNILK